MSRAVPLWLASLVAACASATTHKIITAADLADPPRTRLAAVLSAPLRDGAKAEETPSTVKSDAIADEVVIKRLTPGEVCFELVARTPISMDAPLASWRVTVDDQPVQVRGEVVTVRDYPCTGEAPVTVVAGLSQDDFAAKRVGEPKEIAFRVVERRASGCFPRAATAKKRVKLVLTLPAADGKGDWGEAFEWHVEGG
ncbi:MAG: hypothetical protein HY906_21550 [Deltaproteobacteria bacterium]|nr:hypothetical protein [Deltaproteobacteria bacterium]